MAGAIDAGRAFAIADDDGHFRAGDAAGGDAFSERFKIRAATAEKDTDAFRGHAEDKGSTKKRKKGEEKKNQK